MQSALRAIVKGRLRLLCECVRAVCLFIVRRRRPITKRQRLSEVKSYRPNTLRSNWHTAFAGAYANGCLMFCVVVVVAKTLADFVASIRDARPLGRGTQLQSYAQSN